MGLLFNTDYKRVPQWNEAKSLRTCSSSIQQQQHITPDRIRQLERLGYKVITRGIGRKNGPFVGHI